MSEYTSAVSYARPQNKNSYLYHHNTASNGNISNLHNDEDAVKKGSIVSGVITAAIVVLMNIGVTTTPNMRSLDTIKTVVAPAVIREKPGQDNTYREEDDSDALEVNDLQSFFGLNTAQLAKILMVERKTIYNWRKSPQTKLKASAVERMAILKKFSYEVDSSHSKFLSKFIFGKNADRDLLNAFFQEPLNLDDLVNAYDKVYTKIEGFAKRSIM